MSDTRDATKKPGGKPGDLALDVARLAEEAGVETADVYAFFCGGGMGSSGGSDWMDKHVSDDVKKHLRFLDS